MAVKEQKIYIPTGYESAQRDAERKRKLAAIMLQQGLSGTNQHMQSWLQPLAAAAQMYAGKRMDKKADRMSDETDRQILADRMAALNELKADEGAGKSPFDIWQKNRGNAITSDLVKPYEEAATAGLKQKDEFTNFGGQWRRKGAIQEGEFEPNKPTDSVIRAPGNIFLENPVATTAALKRQGYTMGGQQPMGVTQMPDPMAAPPPGMPAQPASAALPAGAGGEDIDKVWNSLPPDKQQVVSQILKQYAGGGGAPGAVPYGNPTSPAMPGGKQPDGVAGGKPYWLINGVPYDNPEGR